MWHLRQSTWPSRGKQPLSSASMDSGFPQSWEKHRGEAMLIGRLRALHNSPHIPVSFRLCTRWVELLLNVLPHPQKMWLSQGHPLSLSPHLPPLPSPYGAVPTSHL